jgi:hypothetical protein
MLDRDGLRTTGDGVWSQVVDRDIMNQGGVVTPHLDIYVHTKILHASTVAYNQYLQVAPPPVSTLRMVRQGVYTHKQ